MGEVIHRPENFLKTELALPSGEALPRTHCQPTLAGRMPQQPAPFSPPPNHDLEGYDRNRIVGDVKNNRNHG